MDVKGGNIEQLKRYAKQLSDHTGDSVCTEITVWHYPKHTGEKFSVDMMVFDSLHNKIIRPSPKTEDLRNLGSVIDEIIRRGGDK